ncbi:MAG: RHS repeat-associated core domain-containing protein [Anaerolineaceae bacterium]|nr:RHS repeat-associated core domain-containing protein [Anaerolineaceae bacterium]
MPGDLSIVYTYDSRGRLIGLTDWDDQETAFAYDLAGRHVATQRPNGLRSRYSYDPAGRLTLLHHASPERTLGHFAYQVNELGNREVALEILPHANSTGDTVIASDDPDLLLKANWSDEAGFKKSEQFSARLTLTFFGDQAVLTMGTGPDHSRYDIYLGRTLWQSFDGYAATPGQRDIPIELTGEGPHQLEIRNRAERSRSASGTGYVVRFKQLLVPGVTYDYRTIVYAYDALSRLQQANYDSGNRVYDFDYDLAGNRLAELVSGTGVTASNRYFGYNEANQLIAEGDTLDAGEVIPDYTYEYDANGNLLYKKDTVPNTLETYAWDQANRLLSTGGSAYQYDGLGNRIQQTAGTTVTRYLLDLQPGLAVVLRQSDGTDTNHYLHALRGVHAWYNETEWQYAIPDALGSVRGVADDAVSTLESRSYTPYGDPFGVTMVENYQSPAYGFTGEPLDENGLLYLRARYYAPGLGVFTALDPFEGMAGRPMSLNGYSWVEGNVVMWVDPSGKLVFLGVLAAIIGGGILGGITYGVGSQVLPNILNGEEVGCIDANQVLFYAGAGGAIGGALAVAFWLGSGAALGTTTLTAAQIGGGVASASGAATNVIGQGLIGSYTGAASLEELVARVSADMAIGGVFGRVMAGVVNSVSISGSRNFLTRIPSIGARGLGAGGVNMVQGVIQRSVRSRLFGDIDVAPAFGPDMLGDLLWGIGLQSGVDMFVLSATGAGELVVQRPGYITRPPVPNPAGDAARAANILGYANLPRNQVVFTITGTNILPNALSESGVSEWLIDLIEK